MESTQSFISHVTDAHGNLDVLKRFLVLCANHNPHRKYVILGGDITAGYVDYLKLKVLPRASFE